MRLAISTTEILTDLKTELVVANNNNSICRQEDVATNWESVLNIHVRKFMFSDGKKHGQNIDISICPKHE